MKQKQKGFTLIELIVVMAIIAILVLIAAPKFMGYTEKAKLTQVINDIKVSEKAAEQYYLQNDLWPRDQLATPYTDEQLSLWVNDFRNLSGETVTLEDGDYYNVDWDMIKSFMDKPNNDFKYIIQNPVGDIYYANELTPAGEITKFAGKIETESLEISSSKTSIEAGETLQLTATLLPIGATNQELTWTSSDESIATIDDTGLITSIKEGTISITVNNAEKTNSISIEVKKKFTGLVREVPAGQIGLYTRADIEKIGTAGFPDTGKYILMSDIDLGPTEWTPLNFSGTFDGNGLTISNMYINKPTLDYVGFFRSGKMDIKNLTLSNINIKGKNYVGGLIASANGATKIYRVKVTGKIVGEYAIGGLVGRFYQNSIYSIPTIDESVVDIDIFATRFDVGGFVGTAEDCIISNSYVRGKIRGDGQTTATVGANGSGATKIMHSYAKIDLIWIGSSRSGGTANTSVYGNSFETTSSLPNMTALSKVNMMKASSYVGYNFSTIWSIQEGLDYPKLKWELRNN